MCQRGLRTHVPNACQLLILMCQHANKCANVPKVCQLFNLVCQCAKRHASFLSWHANVLKGMPNFQTFLLWNAKGNVLGIKIVLCFISILHVILKKSVQNFCFLKLFCSLIKNENTKRPGFYTSNKDCLRFSSTKTTKQKKRICVNIVIFLN